MKETQIGNFILWKSTLEQNELVRVLIREAGDESY